jgi:hypothetical protein
MADTPKKNKSTAPKTATATKPRNTAAKKSTNSVSADPVSPNGHAAAHGRSVSNEEVARLAHHFWQERGGKHGYHMEDWFRAEQELQPKSS